MDSERSKHVPWSHRASPWGALWGLLAAIALLLAPGADGAGAQDGEDEHDTLGAEVYEETCVRCHRDGGRGMEGVFPSLRENDLIQGPTEPLLVVILEGREAMPGFGESLSDEQIAAVLTYLRSRWGNDGDRIEAEEIARIRKHVASVGTEDRLGRSAFGVSPLERTPRGADGPPGQRRIP